MNQSFSTNVEVSCTLGTTCTAGVLHQNGDKNLHIEDRWSSRKRDKKELYK